MTTSRPFRWGFPSALALFLLAGTFLWYSRYQDKGLEVNAGLGKERILGAVTRGLDFLAERQSKTGVFPTYSWKSEDLEAKKKYLETPYTVAQILLSLSFIDDDAVGRRLRERAITYILSREEPGGVWSHQKTLTPDPDDTALVWAGLSMHGMAVDPEVLEALRANRTEAGLFPNLFPGHKWPEGHPELELSPGVNLNVLLLFALVGQPLPEVCGYIVRETRTKRYQRGTLYSPPLTYAFLLSRVYADGGADCLAEVIPEVRSYVLAHQRPDSGWGNDLETALGVLVLLNAGERGAAVTRGIKVILDRQDQDGGWDTSPFYHSAARPYIYFGSRSLNTGLCLEALGKYLKR